MLRVLLLTVCLLAAATAHGAVKRKHHHQRHHHHQRAPKDSLDRSDDNEATAVKFQSVDELEQEWQRFKSNHEKSYDGAEEEEKRKKIFAENVKEIDEHNALYDEGRETYTKAVNQFADLTNAEFLEQITCLPKTNLSDVFRNTTMDPHPAELFPPGAPLPSWVDWRSRGYVTRVKNQGRCGSCWAFAAVGALESQLYLKTGQLVYLSEQNLVDCDPFSHGCEGGWPHLALEFIRLKGGIDTEDSYQYEAEDARCRYDSRAKGGHVDGVRLIQGSEELLQRAVAYVGPVVVAIDASGLKFYASGIYSSDRRELDHAVLAVGYKSSGPGRDYWIYKNSWGVKWGMDGYGLLARNKQNSCGIGYYSTYPRIF